MGRTALAALLEVQRPNLALWAPVFFGLGIGVYFAVPAEPLPWALAALGGTILLLGATATRVHGLARVALIAAILPAAGFETAALRSLVVAAPVLPGERTAAVEGRISGLSRSASDRTRVLLDRVVIHGLEPAATPRQVRISLDPGTAPEVLTPGQRVIVTARLSPPAGPSEPGGFDFRRTAWFDGIGAVGYARTPMVEMEGSRGWGFHQLAFRIQVLLSAHIRAIVPGQNGAFAAAVFTGDRSAIDREVEEHLRLSTLYHVVSIGGLHMSLLAGAMFAILRYGLALVPRLALVWPLKKIAAAVSIAVTFAYLAISGFEVAAQRAFITTTVFLVAVLIDRPALTLRSVALAAFVVLAFAPESLNNPGFQMSFAGTIALIAAFDGLRTRAWWQATQTEARWWYVKPVIAAFMTSLVAGLATAPFSVFHFNVLAQYGLLANLLAMPAIGLVVMPAAVVALLSAPLGLDWIALTAAGWGIGYFLEVSAWVAGLGGAASGVPEGPGAVLGLIALGGLFVVLWIGRARWFGLVPIALALLIWGAHERPEVLIAENGRLFGIRTETGRALSTDRGADYAAQTWLENDGDVASREEAAARGRFGRARNRIEAEVPGLGSIVYVGRSDPAGASADCAAAAVLIAPNWPSPPEGPCVFIGAERLRAEGALAIRLTPDGPLIEGALARNRARPWTRDPRAMAPFRGFAAAAGGRDAAP